MIHAQIGSDPFAVRDWLTGIFADARLGHLPEDLKGSAEIVLAEALNNVVEHAYAGTNGTILIELAAGVGALACVVRDSGHPMPGLNIPEGRLPAMADDLPEGGFGWHLIRTLSRDLTYCRQGGQNVLSFRVVCDD